MQHHSPIRFVLLSGVLSLALVVAGSSSAQEETPSELIQILVDLLQESDPQMRSLAFEQIRSETRGQAATEAFAGQLPKLPAETQTGLLSALADRGDQAAHGPVIQLLETTDDPTVQREAVEAIGALGTDADVPRLVSYLQGSSEPLQEAARRSLIRLQGDNVAEAIVQAAEVGTESIRVELIDVLASRRALDKLPQLEHWALSDSAAVRQAAMTALGQIAGPDRIPGMVQGVLKARRGAEQEAAEKNVMFVCQRIEPAAAQALPLLEAVKQLPDDQQPQLLSTVGRVGTLPALAHVLQALSNPQFHDLAVAALTNWPDSTVVSRLIEIAQSDPSSGNRVSALRALIRIAPLPDGRSDLQKLELLKTAMAMSVRDAERRLAIRRAAAIRIPETLRWVLPYVSQEAFAEQACETIVELAHHRELRDANKQEFHAALDRVLETSDNATVKERATRYKNGQTWVRPR